MSDLSLEFLMGRALDNAMLNVGLKDAARGIFEKSAFLMDKNVDGWIQVV